MGSVALWTVRVALAARGRKVAGAGVAAVEALVFALAFTHLAAALDAPERGVATGSGSPPARSSVSSPTNDSTRSRSEVRAVVPAPIWPWSTTSTRPAGRSPGAVPADRTAPSRCCSSRSMIVGRRTSSPSCVSCARRRSSRFTVSVRCTLLRPHRSPHGGERRTRCPSTPSAHERTEWRAVRSQGVVFWLAASVGSNTSRDADPSGSAVGDRGTGELAEQEQAIEHRDGGLRL